MSDVSILQHVGPATAERPTEFVERRGLGHPDTVCDAIAESISVALCRTYREVAGRVLHHDVDGPPRGGQQRQCRVRLQTASRADTPFLPYGRT